MILYLRMFVKFFPTSYTGLKNQVDKISISVQNILSVGVAT